MVSTAARCAVPQLVAPAGGGGRQRAATVRVAAQDKGFSGGAGQKLPKQVKVRRTAGRPQEQRHRQGPVDACMPLRAPRAHHLPGDEFPAAIQPVYVSQKSKRGKVASRPSPKLTLEQLQAEQAQYEAAQRQEQRPAAGAAAGGCGRMHDGSALQRNELFGRAPLMRRPPHHLAALPACIVALLLVLVLMRSLPTHHLPPAATCCSCRRQRRRRCGAHHQWQPERGVRQHGGGARGCDRSHAEGEERTALCFAAHTGAALAAVHSVEAAERAADALRPARGEAVAWQRPESGAVRSASLPVGLP